MFVCEHHRKSRYYTSKRDLVLKFEKSKKLVKSIPAAECGPEQHIITNEGKSYLITQDTMRQKFTLYRAKNDGYERVATDSGSPTELNKLAYTNI